MFSKTLLASLVLALGLPQALAAGVKYAGVNIAGFDFGCTTDGTCVPDKTYGAIQKTANVGDTADGPGQMNHFVTKDKFNMFRLPVGWQFLVNSKLGGTLDAKNFGDYDKLMQSCLKTGAYCVIDIHNYARWNGQTIGSSGGPTNNDFTSLWKQLATKYAAEEKVVMGLMNEPHDMPSLNTWVGSVQAAVTVIREAGATSQMILLPGDGYTGAHSFVSGGSAAALAGVTNPDKSTTNLIFEVHQYFDNDFSGTTLQCTKNSEVLVPLRNWLKSANRQALLAETGGGKASESCITNVCEVLDFLNENSGQFLGYIGWAAGSFDTSYVLSLTPEGGKDVPLMEKCFAAKFGGGSGTSPVTPAEPSEPETSPSSTPSSEGVASPPSPSSTTTPAAAPPPSSTTKPQTKTSSSAPSSSTSSSPPPYGLGQAPPSVGGNLSPNDFEQDDCEAEWEDAPVPEPEMVRKRNGRLRLMWADEI